MIAKFLICLLLALTLNLLRMAWELAIMLEFLGQPVRGWGTSFWLHHGFEVTQRPVFWVAVVFWSGLILLVFEAARRLGGHTKGRTPGVTRAKAELEDGHG